MLLLLFPPNHSSFILWISKHFSITNNWGRRKAMLPLRKLNDIAMILITNSFSCSPNEYNNVYIILRKQTGKFQRIRQGTNPQLLQPVPLKKGSWFLSSSSAQALVSLGNVPLHTLHKHTKLLSCCQSFFPLYGMMRSLSHLQVPISQACSTPLMWIRRRESKGYNQIRLFIFYVVSNF